MKNRKFLVLFLTASLIISLAGSFSVQSVSAAAWNGSVSASLVGSGTAADPYQIANGSDLAYLAQKVNGGDSCAGVYFKQMDDIDLGGSEWTPIGISDKIFFAGVYDGSGFVVKNFKVTSQQWGGLFGYMNGGSDSGIKDVIVSGAEISGTYCGGVIAYAIGGSYLKGCVTTADCIVKGNNRVGGIASTLSTGSSISYCINNATVIGVLNSNNTFYGGVTGVIGGSSTMSYCVNNGKVTAESLSNTMADKYSCFGGITGCSGAVNATGNIDHCYNTGSVEIGKLDALCSIYAGGIAGVAAHVDAMSHKISDCFNFGNVKCEVSSPQVYCGSFAGQIKFFGLELKNVFSLTGTANDLVALVNFDPTGDGFDFTDRTTLEKKAASVNKNMLEYNIDFSKWLLNLDISNVEETTPVPETTPAAQTTTAPAVTTTAPPESKTTTTRSPDTTEVPSVGKTTETTKTDDGGKGCKSSAVLPAGIVIFFALALFNPLKKKI